MKKLLFFLIFSTPILFSGCASFNVVNLGTQTNASATIQLNSVPAAQRTVFLAWSNSANANYQLQNQITQAMQASGYRLVQTPTQAHYLVKITLMTVGLATSEQLSVITSSDFNDPLPTLQSVSNNNDSVSGVNVVDVSGLTPVMVLDIQISERAVEGNSTTWNRYQTRVVSRASQPNVTFKQEQSKMNSEVMGEIQKIFSA